MSIELEKQYRHLVCKLLDIDPNRPMPQEGFGLAFFTREEISRVAAQVWRLSPAMTLIDPWEKIPLRQSIPMLKETLRTAASIEDDCYVSIGLVWPDKLDTYAKAKTFIESTPEIRSRKPRPQRLEVHAGDWVRYWSKHEKHREVSEDSADEFRAEAMLRKPEIDANRSH